MKKWWKGIAIFIGASITGFVFGIIFMMPLVVEKKNELKMCEIVATKAIITLDELGYFDGQSESNIPVPMEEFDGSNFAPKS